MWATGHSPAFRSADTAESTPGTREPLRISVPGIPPNMLGAHSGRRPVSASYSSMAWAEAAHWTVSPPTSVLPPNVAGA